MSPVDIELVYYMALLTTCLACLVLIYMAIWTQDMYTAWHGVHMHNVKHETPPGGKKIHGLNFLFSIYLKDTWFLMVFQWYNERKFYFTPTKASVFGFWEKNNTIKSVYRYITVWWYLSHKLNYMAKTTNYLWGWNFGWHKT